jgi:hypothetical protein
MHVFLTGCVLFFAAFTAHVIIWRIRLPKNQTLGLLKIFALALCFWLGVGYQKSFPLLDTFHIALFYGSMSLCYVITYSAVEGDSPTLSLMRFLDQKGNTGGSISEIDAFFAERPFIRSRLVALLNSSLISQENGRYFIAGTPSLPFRLILAFRKVYGTIPKGG